MGTGAPVRITLKTTRARPAALGAGAASTASARSFWAKLDRQAPRIFYSIADTLQEAVTTGFRRP